MALRVLVTGVSRGIGRAIAERFARDGWEVAGTDRREPERDAPLDRFLKADFVDAEAAMGAIEELAGRGIDALVNNAAIQPSGSIIDSSPGEWDDTLAVNVRGPALAMKAARSALRQRRGAVVNIASIHALATSPGRAAYVASKGALLSLTRAAALELAPDGVRVNAVLPGAVETDMLRESLNGSGVEITKLAASTPLGRIADPLEIAEAVLFLADRDRSSFITGHGLVADGGVLARLASE